VGAPFVAAPRGGLRRARPRCGAGRPPPHRERPRRRTRAPRRRPDGRLRDARERVARDAADHGATARRLHVTKGRTTRFIRRRGRARRARACRRVRVAARRLGGYRSVPAARPDRRGRRLEARQAARGEREGPDDGDAETGPRSGGGEGGRERSALLQSQAEPRPRDRGTHFRDRALARSGRAHSDGSAPRRPSRAALHVPCRTDDRAARRRPQLAPRRRRARLCRRQAHVPLADSRHRRNQRRRGEGPLHSLARERLGTDRDPHARPRSTAPRSVSRRLDRHGAGPARRRSERLAETAQGRERAALRIGRHLRRRDRRARAEARAVAAREGPSRTASRAAARSPRTASADRRRAQEVLAVPRSRSRSRRRDDVVAALGTDVARVGGGGRRRGPADPRRVEARRAGSGAHRGDVRGRQCDAARSLVAHDGRRHHAPRRDRRMAEERGCARRRRRGRRGHRGRVPRARRSRARPRRRHRDARWPAHATPRATGERRTAPSGRQRRGGEPRARRGAPRAPRRRHEAHASAAARRFRPHTRGPRRERQDAHPSEPPHAPRLARATAAPAASGALAVPPGRRCDACSGSSTLRRSPARRASKRASIRSKPHSR
jgi:hypothetical protein